MTGDEAKPDERLRDLAGEWPVADRRDVFRAGLPFALRADRVRRPGHPEDEPFTRLVLEHPGAAVVLAMDDDDRVLCLRQYRHAARGTYVELPAGLFDGDGEEPLAVAQRELREEAGLRADSWTPLASAFSSPGIVAERIHYFLARDVSESGRGDFALVHEEAEMEAFWVPFDDLHAAVLDGRVSNGPTLIAVLTCAAKGLHRRGSREGRL